MLRSPRRGMRGYHEPSPLHHSDNLRPVLNLPPVFGCGPQVRLLRRTRVVSSHISHYLPYRHLALGLDPKMKECRSVGFYIRLAVCVNHAHVPPQTISANLAPTVTGAAKWFGCPTTLHLCYSFHKPGSSLHISPHSTMHHLPGNSIECAPDRLQLCVSWPLYS